MTGSGHSCPSYLREYDFLRPQLPKQSLELCTTHVVVESAEIELAGCTIQDAYPEAPIFPTCLVLTNGETMSGLIIGKEFIVNQSTIGVDFI